MHATTGAPGRIHALDGLRGVRDRRARDDVRRAALGPGPGIADGRLTRAAQYLPMFLVGVLLAFHEQHVRRVVRRVPATLLAARDPFPIGDLRGPVRCSTASSNGR